MRWTVHASLLALLACGRTELARPAEPQPPDVKAERRPAAARLAKAAQVRKRLGLLPEYKQVPGIEAVKIAVLDYGFAGVGGGRPYLPANTVVVEHYEPALVRRFDLGDPDYRKPLDPRNHHGRTMAQIIWAVTGFHPKGPRFYLLNANGPTMLRRAVRYAIEQKVDIILFSGAFEGGGNGDGRGPINRIVADALAAGILWVNAAGNYGHCVYEGPVRLDRDGYLRFRAGRDGTALRFRNYLDENSVTVTLTWNDYREEEDAGTDKDLDLYVEDWIGKRLGASEKTQVSGDRVPGAGKSRNPRERIVLSDLAANKDFNYRIRVRARKNNVFTARDRIRILVTTSQETYVDPASNSPREAVKFFDATGKGELYPPADNPLVLTVGDLSPISAVGPTADGRVKPDVVLQGSRAFFTDGEVSSGSSNAAAFFAGIVAVLKAVEPELCVRHLLDLARQNGVGTGAATARGLTASTFADLRTPQAPLARYSRSLPGTGAYPADPRFLAPSYPYGLLPSGGSAYRFYQPPLYAVTPWGRTLVVNPDPRMGIVQFPGLPASGISRPSAAVLVPAQRPAASVSKTPALRGPVWRTPSRVQLAEVVRANR